MCFIGILDVNLLYISKLICLQEHPHDSAALSSLQFSVSLHSSPSSVCKPVAAPTGRLFITQQPYSTTIYWCPRRVSNIQPSDLEPGYSQGRRAVRRNGELNRGKSCALMWMFLHVHSYDTVQQNGQQPSFVIGMSRVYGFGDSFFFRFYSGKCVVTQIARHPFPKMLF